MTEHTPQRTEQREASLTPEATPVERLLFQRRLLFSPFLYDIYMDEEDEKLLKEWKMQIDTYIEEVKTELKNGTLRKSRKETLGEHPTEADIILFCIARFIMRKQTSDGCFQWKFVKKSWPGGRHHLREIGTEFDTCIDTSAIAKTLAAQYGIAGEIVRQGKLLHYYWQQQGDKKAIIDTFWLRRKTGYLNQPEQYKTIAKPGVPLGEETGN